MEFIVVVTKIILNAPLLAGAAAARVQSSVMAISYFSSDNTIYHWRGGFVSRRCRDILNDALSGTRVLDISYILKLIYNKKETYIHEFVHVLRLKFSQVYILNVLLQ